MMIKYLLTFCYCFVKRTIYCWFWRVGMNQNYDQIVADHVFIRFVKYIYIYFLLIPTCWNQSKWRSNGCQRFLSLSFQMDYFLLIPPGWSRSPHCHPCVFSCFMDSSQKNELHCWWKLWKLKSSVCVCFYVVFCLFQ